MSDATVHDAVGGEPFFTALVDRFYDRVEADAVLRPLYPADTTDSRRHLALFLVQYWGGPTTYSEQRGHPRLRMRHAGFTVGPAERTAWYQAMRDAVCEAGLDVELEAQLLDYFTMAADHMINVPS